MLALLLANIPKEPPREQALGDKTSAREVAVQCGVPVIPGSQAATRTAADAMAFAEGAGFPVMLKAAMGGGGRGMRVVRRSALLGSWW